MVIILMIFSALGGAGLMYYYMKETVKTNKLLNKVNRDAADFWQDQACYFQNRYNNLQRDMWNEL